MIKILFVVFWVVMSFGLIGGYQCFELTEKPCFNLVVSDMGM